MRAQQLHARCVPAKGGPEQRRPARLIGRVRRRSRLKEQLGALGITPARSVGEWGNAIPACLVWVRERPEEQPHGAHVTVGRVWRALVRALRRVQEHRRAIRLDDVEL